MTLTGQFNIYVCSYLCGNLILYFLWKRYSSALRRGNCVEPVLSQERDEYFVHLKRRSKGKNTCFLLGQEDEKRSFNLKFQQTWSLIACLMVVSYHQHLKLREFWSWEVRCPQQGISTQLGRDQSDMNRNGKICFSWLLRLLPKEWGSEGAAALGRQFKTPDSCRYLEWTACGFWEETVTQKRRQRNSRYVQKRVVEYLPCNLSATDLIVLLICFLSLLTLCL